MKKIKEEFLLTKGGQERTDQAGLFLPIYRIQNSLQHISDC